MHIKLTAGQAATFRVVVEQLLVLPANGEITLERMVLTEWYKRNAGKLVLIPETLRLTFTPSQAYALNELLKTQPLYCEAATNVARLLIWAIGNKKCPAEKCSNEANKMRKFTTKLNIFR